LTTAQPLVGLPGKFPQGSNVSQKLFDRLDDQQQPPVSKSGVPKDVSAPLRMLIRPILFLALGLHALLIFVPLPSEEKLKQPDDKKNPITITQVPTNQPPAASVRPAAKPAAKPAVTVAAKPAPLTPRLAPVAPFIPSPPASPILPLQTGSLPSLPRPSESTQETTPTPPIALANVEPGKALYELLAEIPVPNKLDPSFTNVAQLEHFAKPELFFKPSDDPDLVPEALPGLDGSPKLAVGEEPEFFYQTFFEQPLQGIFEQVTKVGDFAGGPLYRLKRGDYTVYLSLIPAQGAVATIVSVWSSDPTAR
jgi:hypothetical protein